MYRSSITVFRSRLSPRPDPRGEDPHYPPPRSFLPVVGEKKVGFEVDILPWLLGEASLLDLTYLLPLEVVPKDWTGESPPKSTILKYCRSRKNTESDEPILRTEVLDSDTKLRTRS